MSGSVAGREVVVGGEFAWDVPGGGERFGPAFVEDGMSASFGYPPVIQAEDAFDDVLHIARHRDRPDASPIVATIGAVIVEVDLKGGFDLRDRAGEAHGARERVSGDDGQTKRLERLLDGVDVGLRRAELIGELRARHLLGRPAIERRRRRLAPDFDGDLDHHVGVGAAECFRAGDCRSLTAGNRTEVLRHVASRGSQNRGVGCVSPGAGGSSRALRGAVNAGRPFTKP